jgi:hypothetical protein
MTGCQLGSHQRILGEERIHKYTHTNHKLSDLNIKYYKFSSSFNTTEFCSRKVNVDAEVIHSMIEGQLLSLRCHPHKRSTPRGSPSTGYNRPKSRSPTGSRPQHHQKGEKNYLYTVRSIRQNLSN